MSTSEYESTANAAQDSATAEGSEAERRARQIAQLVEAERQSRRRTLKLYLALLAVPVALALALLFEVVRPASVYVNPDVVYVNSLDGDPAASFNKVIEPLVQGAVGEQLRPVVEEKLGGQIDTAIERRVGDKIQGASPEKVRELGESVERLKGDLSQVQAGVREVQQVKETLPQIREQLSAQVENLQRIETRMTQVPPDSNPGLAAEVRKLQERIGGLETHLNSSLKSLSSRVEENSRSVKLLSDRFSGIRDTAVPEKEGTRGKKPAVVTRKPPR